MRYDLSDIVMNNLWVFGLLIAVIIYLGSTGHIVVEKDYWDDLVECTSKNKELKKDLDQYCPEPKCECNFGSAGTIWMVWGGIFYVGGLVFFFWGLNWKEKKEKELQTLTKEIEERERNARAIIAENVDLKNEVEKLKKVKRKKRKT